MAILPITLYGDKILREKSKDILKIDDRIIKIVEDMFDTMHNADGVGLAANQVNLDKSIFVIDLRPVEGYEKTKPLVFINPKITLRSENLVPHDEGCLSLPYIRAEVIRPEAITIEYLDINENLQKLETNDFLARVIQHEYDHLIGKVIADRVEPFIRKKLKKDLLDIKKRNIDVDYPVTEI
jgi:peptide deformylase